MTPIMLNALTIGIITFAVILTGAFAGWAIRQRLPAHHLSDETKNLVSVSMAVVATVSALVLGLLISNANTSFRALGGEVTTLSAQILRLDQILRRYGPDTEPARETLRQYAGTSCGRCRWNDSRIGAWVWRADPYLAAANAPGGECIGGIPVKREGILRGAADHGR